MIYVIVALALLCALLWAGVIYTIRAFPVPPLVDIQNDPGVRRPITRGDLQYIQTYPIAASSAVAYVPVHDTSAYR